MKLMVLVVAVLGVMCGTAHAEKLVWKTEAEMGARQELPGCDPEKEQNCGDSVSYVSRSIFGVNEYLTYFEGVRAQIGFGAKPNGVSMFLADQLHPGAYDWGGVEVGGVFTPKFVIKRFYEMTQDGEVKVDRDNTQLLIFRLNADSTSCVAQTEGSTADNATARQWAEQSPPCAP